MPDRYTCNEGGFSPPMWWSNVPEGTVELAVVVDDPDAPGGTYVHWIVVGLSPTLTRLAAGEVPDGALEIGNSGGFASYQPPCSSFTHTYRLAVYALGQSLDLREGCSAAEALEAIRDAATAAGILYTWFGTGGMMG